MRGLACLLLLSLCMLPGCAPAGVGTAAEIYVAVPFDGQIYLTRGAVFDYYEFVSPRRLTDEEWQQLLTTDPPARPQWTESYMRPGGNDVPVPAEPYVDPC